ncbi:EAL domain-containing protein [Noviherbaspirillum sp. L7-7A]|uniref:bifunctional diguanylate cyclase/phosphodiesterase n=1 Tax=Noviherbaspirillum sp. L7-7A TaxID=2850560 RepID=UPI001C2BAC26|nr:EAL domain-containing protein [Noviherbaspirillum sp. L7-7A]MBV0881463.1 EAL domain-containing protein [Noviherbaspirillum sp. L7-7A]
MEAKMETQSTTPSNGLIPTLDDITDAFFTVDQAWRFTFINKSAEVVLQQTRHVLLQSELWDAFKETIGTDFERECRRAMTKRRAVEFENYYAPWKQWFEIHVHPFSDGLAVYFKDITSRHRREAFTNAQMHIMERIAAGAPVDEILNAVIDVAESQDTRIRGSVLLLNAETRRLYHGTAPKLPQEFIEAINGVEIGPAVGSCGTAAYLGEPIIVEDISRDPLWANYKDLALRNALYACWSMPIIGSTGQVYGTFAVYSDAPRSPDLAEMELLKACSYMASVVIERERAVATLKENEQRFREQASLLDKAQDAIFVVTMDESIIFWNKSAERLYGWTKEEVLGKSERELCCGNASVFDLVVTEVLNADEWRGELTVRRKNGTCFMVEGRSTLVRDDNGAPQSILSIHTDISDRKAAQREIHQLAFYDALTGLPNRQLLLDRLEHELLANNRRGSVGAVMFIDLDNFKVLNDTLGHDMGDLLLQQVAQRLSQAVREGDTVARWGGDEFVVVVGQLGMHVAEAVGHADHIAEQIRTSLNSPYDLNKYEHHTTPSIGIALFQGPVVTVEELLKHADLAMYQAKAAGRNTIQFFDPQMQAAIKARVTMETNMRRSLLDEDFLLYYQPQMDRNGQIVGAEALLRWLHPQHGVIAPVEFIHLAEDTGLILPLGEWILDTACRQLAKWATRAETSQISLAVNVSARQFRHPDFVNHILQAIDKHRANPRRLKLELTESLLLDDVGDTAEKMNQLRTIGIEFSLDDFGTGYSSLSYLKRLPFEQLKVDQSFVRDIQVNEEDATLVKTIITLGRNLGLKVVAEGVMTKSQFDFLDQCVCDAFQGYFFSEALPEENFEEFIATGPRSRSLDQQWSASK